MKLSIVIICWNDWKVIENCLASIYSGTKSTDFEVIVSDNGSEDDSPARIRRHFPQVRVVENGKNLGFAKGNNAGISKAQGEYTLILNPDTIVHDATIDKLVAFAERHPEAGGFGCRVLNPDGSYQEAARPFPTLSRDLIAALYLRPLGMLTDTFVSDKYMRWHGDTERTIDWQSGCCVMFRTAMLNMLGGFDEQFFYHFEEVDLCRRVWATGHSIVFSPEPTIIHLGGQSVKRFPVRFELERNRSRYRYYHKHFGPTACARCRIVSLVWLRIRQFGYSIVQLLMNDETIRQRIAMYRLVADWTTRLDPVKFVEIGEEPVVPGAAGQAASA